MSIVWKSCEYCKHSGEYHHLVANTGAMDIWTCELCDCEVRMAGNKVSYGWVSKQKPLINPELCRYCGKPVEDHEYMGEYKGLHCYLLGDCDRLRKWRINGEEAPHSRSLACESIQGCLASPKCIYKCILLSKPDSDPVNHPSHYTSHPSGVECIQITEHMNFCLGNAMKYIWRAGLKGNEIEDISKAIWYLERERARRTADTSTEGSQSGEGGS